MRLRALALLAPAAVMIGLSVRFWGAPQAVRIIATVAVGYVALVALTVVRRIWPPAPHSLMGGTPRRNPALADRGGFLEQVESAILRSRSSRLDYERELRPILYRIAAARLRARGVSVEREPEEAERFIGAQAWSCIRPPVGPLNREAPGLSVAEIEDIVNRIEEV